MAEEMKMDDVIKTTVDELLKVLATDNVIGETMEVGDKVIIPITKVGLAFASGSGMGSMGSQKGAGAGAGGGASLEALSVIVVFKDVKGPEGIQILSIRGMGPLGKMMTDVGHAAKEMVGEGTEGSEEEAVTPKGPGSKPEM